jgi:hypothetical protein
LDRDWVSDLELKPVDVGGYQIIEAGTKEEAIDIARGAPHVALGGTTVVRPATRRWPRRDELRPQTACAVRLAAGRIRVSR